ncbi:MAG: triphosphoribosyl-dephospho-CoA synthase [Terrimicrobiaceae bacterium]
MSICKNTPSVERTISPAAIARCASRALREELAAYPKPGLVSHVDNGSHPDMDAACFLNSIDCLEPFFERMAESGAQGCSLRALQKIGVAAEEAMWTATGGRNTHRGAIFCLGLLAAAAGRRENGGISSLGEIVENCWGRDLLLPDALPGISDGIAMCHRHGIAGARGEAKRGFPSVYGIGLPALRNTLPHAPRSVASVQVFFEILAHCEDTTLLKRGGADGLRYAREEASRFLDRGGVLRAGWETDALGIHRAFVARQLTAGGAADLLAATLFVHHLEELS